MALTRVSRHIIDEPFNPTTVSATDVTATNINASGIGTVGTLRVTGDLTVEGTTTTLDSILTEVDRLEVSANSTVAAGIITQTGSGDILNLYDGSTEVFTVTDGGNIGIGSETPGAPLDIAKTTPVIRFTDTDAGQYAELLNSGSSFYISADRGNGGNGDIIFRSGGTSEKLRITSDGKVGIGTDNPVSKIQLVAGNSVAADNGNIVTISSGDGTSGNLVNKLNFGVSSTNNYAWIQSVKPGTNTYPLLLNPLGGNVGIGTDNPSNTLHVQGIARFNNSSNNLVISTDSGNPFVFVEQNAPLLLGTNSTERLRITSDGKVGIGTDNPEEDLHIASNSPYILLEDYDNSREWKLKGTAWFAIEDTTAGEDRLRIDSSGSLSAGGSIVTDSDMNWNHDTYQRPHIFAGQSGGNPADGVVVVASAETDPSNTRIGSLAFGCKTSSTTGVSNSGLKAFISVNTNANVSDAWKTGAYMSFHNRHDNGNLVERLRITSDGKVRLPDDGKLTLGAGDDLQIWSDNTDQYIRGEQNQLLVRSNNLKLQSYLGENYIHCANNNDVSLFYDNSKKFETTSTGAKVTGALEVTQEYPSIRPTLDLNFAATKTLDRRITFTRDSVGTYIDENGLVKYASNNTPRFDHDPTTGESLGLLIEESRINYCRSSVDLGSPSWQGSGSYNIDNAITNPDGSVGAYHHTGAELHHTMDISGASTNIIRVSLWVKERSGQSGNIDLQIYQQVSGTIINLGGPGFNPATGVIVTHTHSSDEKVVEYHNGWYRIAFTMTTPSGNFTSSTRIDLQNSEHYVWGIQVEAATFETSYIPTSGSTVTRARDYAKITGTNFSDFYNKDEGTLFVNYKLDKSNYLYSPVGVDMVKFEADGNSGGYNIRIVSNASTPQLDVHGVDNGAAQFDMVGINLSDGLKDYFVAQAFALNDLAVSFNGAAPQTDTSVTVVEWDKLYIGTTPRRAHYKSVKYYPKRLPNAQLQGLTQQ